MLQLINKSYLNFMNVFKKKRKKTHQCNIIDTGKNNIIETNGNNNISINVSGNNNTISIKKLAPQNGKLIISLHGDNSKIFIEENLHIGSTLGITMGQNHPNFGKCSNAELKIGKNTSIGSASIITYNSNAQINIGNNCMFAWGIELYHTDAHPVIDKETGSILNKVKKMIIGDHCWLGADCCILKNVCLPNNTIVGNKAVVTKSFTEEYTAIAGNPAKTVKTNVDWAQRADGYIENIQ